MRAHERIRRRDSFERDASAYSAVRPGYPAATRRAAAEHGRLRPGARVLEVGCGTGQATEWLADLGCDVVAMDRAPEMLKVARRQLAGRPNVEIREDDFEAGRPTAEFDALVFATSYHWMDPGTRAPRCADHLVGGGALVLLWHTHPPPFTGYYERVQPIYERRVPGWDPPPSPGVAEDRIRAIVQELVDSGRFEQPLRHSEDWSRRYGREDYLALLSTYSDHILLPDDVRKPLFGEIAGLIDAEFGGEVVRPYRTELVVARRREGAGRGDAR